MLVARLVGVVVVGLLAVPAAATLTRAGWAVVQTVGLDYAEPVIYGQANRLVGGEALYQPIDSAPFTVAAYTPLYYWLAAGLQVVLGTGFWPGRLLSLVAGIAAAVLVGVVAGRRRGGVLVGAAGGLLFLALGFAGTVPWLGLYRVDTLGVALSLASVALLTRSTGPRALVAAGVLAGLALLCKQTFVAAWLAGTLWLWDRRHRQIAAMFCASALLTLAIPCLLLEVTTQGAFLQNTLVANVNPFEPAIAAGLLPLFLHRQWLPLMLAGVYLAVGRPWRANEPRLLVLYWALSSVSLGLGIAKVGASFNYWIEFAAATAILAAPGAAAILEAAQPRLVAVSVVGLLLAVGTALDGPIGMWASARTVREDVRAVRASVRDLEFDALVDRVRHEPGAVLAEPMDVVVLAGRQVLLEPFIYNLLLSSGRWQADGLVARICNGEIGLVVLGYPLEVGARMTDGLYALWPAPVMTALQTSMTLDGVQATRYLYTARQLRDPATPCGDHEYGHVAKAGRAG